MSEIKHKDNSFSKEVDGFDVHLDYKMIDDKTIEFHHTWVDPELRGKGLAKEIIEAGLEYAMKNSYKIIPSCWAVQRFIDIHEKYSTYQEK